MCKNQMCEEPETMEFMLAPRLPEASEHESVPLEPEAM